MLAAERWVGTWLGEDVPRHAKPTVGVDLRENLDWPNHSVSSSMVSWAP